LELHRFVLAVPPNSSTPRKLQHDLERCNSSRIDLQEFTMTADHTLPPSDESTPASAADFERSLAELEAIVEKLEQGELSLDDSLRCFERGVQLTSTCQSALKQAEQKVEILMRKNAEQFEAAPFDSNSNANGG
jgi:exodeoxyribonuclease VII small subunit